MALSPGEQALVDRGVPVTSTTIPAAARERINTAIAIKQRVNEIQAAEGGDTEKARYLIATEAQKAGISADQIADALGSGLTGSQVGEMARSVGIQLGGYTPPANSGVAESTAIDSGIGSFNSTGGGSTDRITEDQLNQLYIDLLGRPVGSEGIEYFLGKDVAADIDLSENPTTLTSYEDIKSALMDQAQAEYQNRQAVLNPDAPEGGNPYQEGTAHSNVYDWFQRNPNATDQEIAAAMSFADVPPQLVSQVTGVPIDDVISRFNVAREASLLGDPNVVGQQPMPGQPAGPGTTEITPGGMQAFNYTDFPGGIYGPGQALPNIFVPAGQQQPAGQQPAGMSPTPTTPTPGTAALGPRTMVSPGITTYAYPEPFGNIDIFNRPGAQSPTTYTPPATGLGAIPPASSTNTTTQQDMTGTIGDGLANLSPAQRALLGSIFG